MHRMDRYRDRGEQVPGRGLRSFRDAGGPGREPAICADHRRVRGEDHPAWQAAHLRPHRRRVHQESVAPLADHRRRGRGLGGRFRAESSELRRGDVRTATRFRGADRHLPGRVRARGRNVHAERSAHRCRRQRLGSRRIHAARQDAHRDARVRLHACRRDAPRSDPPGGRRGSERHRGGEDRRRSGARSSDCGCEWALLRSRGRHLHGVAFRPGRRHRLPRQHRAVDSRAVQRQPGRAGRGKLFRVLERRRIRHLGRAPPPRYRPAPRAPQEGSGPGGCRRRGRRSGAGRRDRPRTRLLSSSVGRRRHHRRRRRAAARGRRRLLGSARSRRGPEQAARLRP